jgi:prepilin-type N-terminal cleavage/methylation domain-containing protein
MNRQQQGFTVVELLVVIAIISVLAALLLPAIQASREAARRARCTNNMAQFGIALVDYALQRGDYPTGYRCAPADGPADLRGTSGFVALLPHLEQRGLYEQLDDSVTIGSSQGMTTNAEVLATRPAVFVCPSDTSERVVHAGSLQPQSADVLLATGSYALVHGSKGPSFAIDEVKYDNTGVFGYDEAFSPQDVRDGLSNTIFIGEVTDTHLPTSFNFWALAYRHESTLRTTENPLNTPPGTGNVYASYGVPLNGAFSSNHPGGGLFLYGDGRVEFLSENVELSVYRALSTRAASDSTAGKP